MNCLRCRLVTILVAGACLALAALCAAGAQGNPEAELAWPQEWVAFGPVAPDQSMAAGGLPDRASLLPGEALRTIPEQLVIGGRKFRGQKVTFIHNRLDLGALFGGVQRGKTVYLLGRLTVEEDAKVQMGAGADWFMQWWLDGEPVYDTLSAGNVVAPIAITNHVFKVSLTKGEHVLAVAVLSGKNSFTLAAGGPNNIESGYRKAMAAGRPRRTISGLLQQEIDFAATRAEFRRALELAQTDSERAAAHLAIADSQLHDYRETDYPAIRQGYAQALALKGANAREKAQAALGIGATYLRELKYDLAREKFAEAGKISSHPSWAPEVQCAVAKSYLQERRYGEARRELCRLLEMKGADPARNLGWEARALLEAIKQAPQVRADHPRLFFNADTWPAIKARALGPEKEYFEAMKARVDRIVPEEIETKDWGMALMQAAFVYRVTGDQALFEKIRKMLRATMDHYLLRIDPGHFESRVACVAALDWVWNDLPPSERQQLARDLINYVYSLYEEDRIWGYLHLSLFGRINYYERTITWYAGLASFNNHLGEVYDAQALALLGRGYLHNQEEIGGNVKSTKDDGAFRTALEYYFASTLNPFWTFLYCWQSALGKPIPENMANLLSPDYVLRNVLALDRGIVHFGYARSWRKSGGMRYDALYNHLGQMIHFFGKSRPQETAITRHLRERMQEKGFVSAGVFPVYPFLMDLENAPAPNIPENLPIARHFERVGQILMSSGFGEEDTYALFVCGNDNEEAHFDATHFTIYKQGYLALDSGTRAHGSPGGTNYQLQTIAHNCVLIYMPGEVLVDKGGKPIELNSGGQRKFPKFANLLAFETDGDYAYAATDATPTYHEDKCAQMVRQFIFLPPDHFVVFDRVTSKKAEYPKTWLLHTSNEPVLTGKEFRADQNQGRIFCRTVYPLDANLEKIGGPGKEFWAAGRNWPIPANSPYLRSIGTDSADNVPENIGRWRVEVKPGQARKQDYFLHLIQVSDQTVEKMVGSKVSETADQIQLTFTVGARTYTISLNKTGDVGGHIRIMEAGKVLVDRNLTRKITPQSGLALTR